MVRKEIDLSLHLSVCLAVIAGFAGALDVAPYVPTALTQRDAVIEFGSVWLPCAFETLGCAHATYLAAPTITLKDSDCTDRLIGNAEVNGSVFVLAYAAPELLALSFASFLSSYLGAGDPSLLSA